MATTTNNSRAHTSASRASTRSTSGRTSGRSDATKIREGLTKARNGSVSYARQTAERTVDVPVGAALVAAERVTDLVEPFTGRDTANRELNGIRTRVERELNKFERRGASARRKARTRARQTRNRFSRELKQRRRRVRTTVKHNRVRAEDGLKRAQNVVQDRVSTLV
jgi:hypothetical protein